VDHEIPDDKKATEHLANERTFLAWVRTSVAIMSLGFVVAKFGLWLRELASHLSSAASQGSGWSGPMGLGMIAFGGALALLAGWRFRVVNRQIDAGKVSIDGGMVLLVTVALSLLAVVMPIYIGMSTAGPP
jgi:putative membrane protein